MRDFVCVCVLCIECSVDTCEKKSVFEYSPVAKAIASSSASTIFRRFFCLF